MWRSSNSNLTAFELQTLSALLSNANSWKILVSWLISYGMDRRQESADRLFLKFNLSHKLQLLNVQHNFCSVMCYVVLIWTLILLTLGNNIVRLLFKWPKPVSVLAYLVTDADKINVSIRICFRIRQILKVRICILTSFVASPLVRIVPLYCVAGCCIRRLRHGFVSYTYVLARSAAVTSDDEKKQAGRMGRGLFAFVCCVFEVHLLFCFFVYSC